LIYDNFFRSPLRHIPGPLLAKLSPAWVIGVSLFGRRAYAIDALHKRYGPVVRVAPHEVSFATADAAREIYVGVNISPFPDPAATGASAGSVENGECMNRFVLLNKRIVSTGARTGG
jgi:hypothetical protein